MRAFAYTTRQESADSRSRAGRYNPSRVLRWQVRNRKYRAVMPCGSSDEWEAFREGPEIFIVSRNTGLGYVGLSRFDWDSQGDIDICGRITAIEDADVFMQNASEDLETDKWEDWSMRTLAKRLQEYL